MQILYKSCHGINIYSNDLADAGGNRLHANKEKQDNVNKRVAARALPPIELFGIP